MYHLIGVIFVIIAVIYFIYTRFIMKKGVETDAKVTHFGMFQLTTAAETPCFSYGGGGFVTN